LEFDFLLQCFCEAFTDSSNNRRSADLRVCTVHSDSHLSALTVENQCYCKVVDNRYCYVSKCLSAHPASQTCLLRNWTTRGCTPTRRLDNSRMPPAELVVFGRPFVKRFTLCYRTVVCLSVCPNCLSVTLVYCGQTVGWIKVKLGMQVGLGPGHIVSDGDPAPPPKKGHIYILRPVRPIWPVHGSYTGRCSRCVVYTDRDRQTDIQRTDSIG